jgi:hypothetical protein
MNQKWILIEKIEKKITITMKSFNMMTIIRFDPLLKDIIEIWMILALKVFVFSSSFIGDFDLNYFLFLLAFLHSTIKSFCQIFYFYFRFFYHPFVYLNPYSCYYFYL